MSVVASISPPKVAYVLKRFPRLSETFIRNEIHQLERTGLSVEIYSLMRPEELASREAVSRLKARVTYLPRGRAIKNLPLLSGHCAAEAIEGRPFKRLYRPAGPGVSAPFPGKDMDDAAVLMMQAAAVASAAWGMGVKHMHAHFATDATTVAMLASRLSGIPYSFTAHAKDIFHTYTERARDDAFLLEKIRGARFVATVSDYNLRHLARLAGPGAAGKIFRLYNGVDLERFRPRAGGREPGLILSVGRLIEKKGFPHLIDACARLRAGGAGFRCVIVGDGPERDALLGRIAARGLANHVSLPGALPEERLLGLIRSASVFVLPAVVSASGDRDGLPTVLLEALAAGLPSVSTAVSGIPEIIEHDRSGLLVPPADAGRLAAALEELLSKPELRERLGRAARAKAQHEFDLRRNAARLRQYFMWSASGSPRRFEEHVDADRVRRLG